MRPLFWRAYYKDETYLDQFEQFGKENRFSDIKLGDLAHFDLIYQGKVYSVDLINGFFCIDGKLVEIEEIKNQRDYGLIYFVRHQKDMSTTGDIKNSRIFPLIGLRVRIGNAEVKRLIKIMPDGRIVLSER